MKFSSPLFLASSLLFVGSARGQTDLTGDTACKRVGDSVFCHVTAKVNQATALTLATQHTYTCNDGVTATGALATFSDLAELEEYLGDRSLEDPSSTAWVAAKKEARSCAGLDCPMHWIEDGSAGSAVDKAFFETTSKRSRFPPNGDGQCIVLWFGGLNDWACWGRTGYAVEFDCPAPATDPTAVVDLTGSWAAGGAVITQTGNDLFAMGSHGWDKATGTIIGTTVTMEFFYGARSVSYTGEYDATANPPTIRWGPNNNWVKDPPSEPESEPEVEPKPESEPEPDTRTGDDAADISGTWCASWEWPDGDCDMTFKQSGNNLSVTRDKTDGGWTLATGSFDETYTIMSMKFNRGGSTTGTYDATAGTITWASNKSVWKKKTPKTPKKGSGSGDPHFKTWTGDKYDYHGECDLVLLDNPAFANGLGLRVHIRTTRVKHWSYIEKVAVEIGSDVLEFSNDIDNFMINGQKVGPRRKHHTTMLAGFPVRRDPQAISVRLGQGKQGKIDLIARANGFPAVVVDGGTTDMFKGSLGLLGDWSTGKRIARDGWTEMNNEDATAFAEEWQVHDTEPMLFESARAPQFPSACVRPDKVVISRLGMAKMQEEAEKACAHWKEDMEDCIFDVMATRDILVAEEGHITEQRLE